MRTYISILLVLVFTYCFSTYFVESRKELRNKVMNQENVIQLNRPLLPNTIDPSRVTRLSWRPRVFLYNGFLSDEECDHLISLGNDNKNRSSINNSTNVVERTTNLDISLEIEDEITARIEERISAWTFLPKGHDNPFSVLYSGPENTKENHNYFGNTSIQLTGDSVLATVVMYLSNVTQGGQIIFPGTESGRSRPKNKIWSDCTKSSITKPIKGNAILFFNLYPNASLDPSSSHARCPITEGDMWWATKIFVVKFVTQQSNSIVLKTTDDDLCTDEDDNCPKWASVGECETNPIFMVGTADYYGTCRKSCNVC